MQSLKYVLYNSSSSQTFEMNKYVINIRMLNFDTLHQVLANFIKHILLNSLLKLHGNYCGTICYSF